jgi:hypothetical protein
MADHRKRIAEIEQILRSGVSSITTDGTSTSYDLDSLRRELRELQAADDTQRGRRPVAARIKLNF